jgi:hypothetical protein
VGPTCQWGGEREGAEDRRRESKRKAYSGEYAKGWANWAGEGRQPVEEVGPHGERGGRERPVAGWAKKAEWPAGLIWKDIDSFDFLI